MIFAASFIIPPTDSGCSAGRMAANFDKSASFELTETSRTGVSVVRSMFPVASIIRP